MEEHPEPGIVLFDRFRFDRRRGLLARRNDDGELVPVAIGSRALDNLGHWHPGSRTGAAKCRRCRWTKHPW